jgi:uncharacterized protein YhhL (DUF1145 family)
MKKTGVPLLLVITLVLISLYPSVHAADSGVITDQQLTTISVSNKGLQVDETIKVTNNGGENATSLRFWIQQEAQDTSIIEVQSGKELTPLIAGNIRTCNLSAANLTIGIGKSLTIELTFFLPATEQYFIQTLLYDTTSLSVIYKDGNTELNLFQGEHLLYGSDVNNALQIRLYKPTEAPLNITMLIIVFVIVLVVLASLLLLLKKQRTKTKKAVVESEETLSTKKSLLLTLLKDLEKQYRAKTITDETYTKLKEEYKTQAVDAMKKLDDLKK